MKKLILTSFILLSIYTTFSQWIPCDTTFFTVTALASSNNYMFAGTFSSGVYISTNNGLNWNQSSLNNRHIWSIVINGTHVFAGNNGYGVYISSNNGLNWSDTNDLNGKCIVSLSLNGSNIFAADGCGTGIYYTTNNGTNWSPRGLNNSNIMAIATNGIFGFAGSVGVYFSNDNGLTWNFSGVNNQGVNTISIDDNFIYAGTSTGAGIYISTNNGQTWNQSSLNNQNINAIINCYYNGNNIILAGNNNGVYLSSNHGASWNQSNQGFPPNNSVYSFCINNNYIFAGTVYGVWKRSLSEITIVSPNIESSPSRFSLFQNYPNPFNPSTTIKFDIPKSSFVQLTIYDILGREITKLVNEELNPGVFSVDLNGSNFASGMYFYKLQTESFTETKKMTLIK